MDKTLQRLRSVAIAAVEYVGMANYPERERAAIRALSRAFVAAKDGRLDDITFTIDEDE